MSLVGAVSPVARDPGEELLAAAAVSLLAQPEAAACLAGPGGAAALVILFVRTVAHLAQGMEMLALRAGGAADRAKPAQRGFLWASASLCT